MRLGDVLEPAGDVDGVAGQRHLRLALAAHHRHGDRAVMHADPERQGERRQGGGGEAPRLLEQHAPAGQRRGGVARARLGQAEHDHGAVAVEARDHPAMRRGAALVEAVQLAEEGGGGLGRRALGDGGEAGHIDEQDPRLLLAALGHLPGGEALGQDRRDIAREPGALLAERGGEAPLGAEALGHGPGGGEEQRAEHRGGVERQAPLGKGELQRAERDQPDRRHGRERRRERGEVRRLERQHGRDHGEHGAERVQRRRLDRQLAGGEVGGGGGQHFRPRHVRREGRGEQVGERVRAGAEEHRAAREQPLRRAALEQVDEADGRHRAARAVVVQAHAAGAVGRDQGAA